MERKEEIENDEMYTMELGRCSLVRIHAVAVDDDGRGGKGEGKDCRRVTIWQGLLWNATRINSFRSHSNLKSKQYVLLATFYRQGNHKLPKVRKLSGGGCRIQIKQLDSRA